MIKLLKFCLAVSTIGCFIGTFVLLSTIQKNPILEERISGDLSFTIFIISLFYMVAGFITSIGEEKPNDLLNCCYVDIGVGIASLLSISYLFYSNPSVIIYNILFFIPTLLCILAALAVSIIMALRIKETILTYSPIKM